MVDYCKQEHSIQRNIIQTLLDPISKEKGLRRAAVQQISGAY